MTKCRLIALFITAIAFSSLLLGNIHAEEKTSCKGKSKHNEQLVTELEAELTQVKRELEDERELRKELQEQLEALTELEENINERETFDNINKLR